MKASYVVKRLLSCGAITLAILGCTAITANTVNRQNEEKVQHAVEIVEAREGALDDTITESTYPTAGITKEIGNQIKEAGLTIQKHDVDVVQTAYVNEEDTTNDVEPVDPKEDQINDLQEKNAQLEEMVKHMEKSVDQYKEDNEALHKKNKKLEKQLNTYKEKEKQQKEASKKSVAKFNPSDVRVLSGATPETLNKLLEGTWLEGHGQVFYDNEQKYGVNALFSMGNAILETGWNGDNWLAKNKNNIYGLNTTKYFESYEHCINHWFELISEHYVGEGYTSMNSIQKKYCPPNSQWDEDITGVVSRLRKNSGVTNE